jgi:hypothetical protein
LVWWFCFWLEWHWCTWWSVFIRRKVAKINCFMLYQIVFYWLRGSEWAVTDVRAKAQDCRRSRQTGPTCLYQLKQESPKRMDSNRWLDRF